MEDTHNNIKYKFFWGGPFSNWYKSNFTINGVTFNCGEQYMMYHKAVTFGDINTAKMIMAEQDPREQKKLGRSVVNFNEDKWNVVKYDIIKNGLREKFKQDVFLKSYISSYYGYKIVEASPFDRIWGIGYKSIDAIKNIDNWGDNLLGRILTELSVELSQY